MRVVCWFDGTGKDSYVWTPYSLAVAIIIHCRKTQVAKAVMTLASSLRWTRSSVTVTRTFRDEKRCWQASRIPLSSLHLEAQALITAAHAKDPKIYVLANAIIEDILSDR